MFVGDSNFTKVKNSLFAHLKLCEEEIFIYISYLSGFIQFLSFKKTIRVHRMHKMNEIRVPQVTM